MGREMRTIGKPTQLVFSDGTRIDYPLYRVAANGFIRGPRGEKVGRGDIYLGDARKLCEEVVQGWIDQMRRFGNTVQGVAVPDTLQHYWDSRSRYAKEWVDPTAGYVHMRMYGKAYWRDEPDCYDIIEISRTDSTYAKESSYAIEVQYVGYRRSDTFRVGLDEMDTVLRGSYGAAESFRSWNYAEIEGQKRAATIEFRAKLQEFLDGFAKQYISIQWTSDPSKLLAIVDEWLAARTITPELVKLLPEVAKLFTKLGYDVEDDSDDAHIQFTISSNEHRIVMTENGIQAVCQYVKDEERLLRLQQLRLQEEYAEAARWAALHPEES